MLLGEIQNPMDFKDELTLIKIVIQEKFEQQMITVSELLDAENDLLKAKLEQSQSENNTIIKLSKYRYSFSSHPIQFE